ncbi:integrase [Yersinia pestis]|nr:integrase [Yersinia pestis]
MGRWWRYKWITFHPSLTLACVVLVWPSQRGIHLKRHRP